MLTRGVLAVELDQRVVDAWGDGAGARAGAGEGMDGVGNNSSTGTGFVAET